MNAFSKAQNHAPEGVCVLRNHSLEAWIIPFGARLMQLWWLPPSANCAQGRGIGAHSMQGQARPLSLGFVNPQDYRQDTMSIGAVCGRYANRIADARLKTAENAEGFTQLDVNHPLGHCIHGGREGMGFLDWQVQSHSESQVTLVSSTPSGHMGFTGACTARVTYSLQGESLCWEAQAEVDAPCPLNLVQHSYWNLDQAPHLQGHHLTIAAQHYHPLDSRELPLPMQSVLGSDMDFRQAKAISKGQVQTLDNAFVLDSTVGVLREVATLSVADLALHLSVDKPLLHIYASAGLKPSAAPLGVEHLQGAGLCLESEDLPNGPALGADVWYHSGRPYRHQMQWRFEALV